jgi:predicted TIM-barrel fold metal-dependent hydrolase
MKVFINAIVTNTRSCVIFMNNIYEVKNMSILKVTDYDRKVYKEELLDFLPDEIIDTHTHVWLKSHERTRQCASKGLVTWIQMVANENPIEDLLETYEYMFPEKKVTPVIFGQPTADIKASNEYVEQSAKKYNLPSLMLTDYGMSGEYLEQEIIRGGYLGIKPYLSNSPDYIPAEELRIFDFLPHEHLKVMNKLKMVVVLHISRPQRLRDPLNIAQLMEIEEKYPDIKLIVAHIGRAYAKEDIGNAFEILSETKNMQFDFSANTLDTAMVECIKAVGTKRILFGSDLPITRMRMYRIVENGKYYNIVPKGLYGDISGDSHMREANPERENAITYFLYEELLAFKRCAEQLSLSRKDVNDILFKNASLIFGLERNI